jgi:hypothetical protein
MDVALYFPYISLPNDSWFTRVLLYWDSVASIVPQRISPRDPEMTPFMRHLIAAQIVRPLRPDHAFSSDRRGGFDQEFLALLDASGLPEPGEQRKWTRLNWEKGTVGLFEQMAARGLAFPEERRWWRVERQSAGLYMAYLVGSMCRVERDLVPVTNASAQLAKLAQPIAGTKSDLDELVYVTIHDVLPIPTQEVPLDELCRFKDTHAERLRDLRVYLTAKLADLVLIPDRTVRVAKLAEVQREVREDVRRLQAEMSKRSWPVRLGGACALASPVLSIGTAVASGGTALALGLGVASAVAGVATAAAGLRVPQGADSGSPLAYAALAGQLRPA